jgi:hypothetical protein
MSDRGVIIAAAGIGLAFLVAGVGYLYLSAEQARDRHVEEAMHAETEHAHADAMMRLQAEEQRKPPLSRDHAMANGAMWLIEKQSPDGAWRSDVYASFKSGTALTPWVVVALQSSHEPGALPLIGRDPVGDGCDWIANQVKADGSLEGAAKGDLDYPVYTAALAVIALSHPEQKKHEKARDAYLKFLLSHQLTEQNGWKREERQYGGWGYCRLLPKRPAPGTFSPPLVESNLSATVFALEALRVAGVKDKEVYAKVLAFVRRCQNSDGGFHFIYDDPVRNKAGEIQPRASSRDAFNSYGSATADGLRALRLAGETDATRIEAAEKWLRTNFRADKHPGKYLPNHEPNRDAVYFYYAASVSKAWDDREAKSKLVSELVARQNADGSWANARNLVREDDPLVATANAVVALANCR